MKKWLGLSLIIHLLFLGILGFRAATSTAPLGVDLKGDPTVVDLIGLASSKAVPTVRMQKSAPPPVVDDDGPRSGEKIVQEDGPATPEVASAPQNFGSRTGTAISGPIGRADGIQADEKQRYIYELRMLIEGRKIYPRISKTFKESGRVMVRFNVLRDGKIQQVEIVDESRYQRLNSAALSLISDIRQYKPLPEALAEQELVIVVPIEYRLN